MPPVPPVPPLPPPFEAWYRARSFHHSAFEDLEGLVAAKERAGAVVSACIPTINESATIGPIVESLRRELVERVPLVDEIVVIDSASRDTTARLAEVAGATVVQDRDIVPELGSARGKGEALWKSLFVTKGEIIVWLDGDIERFHPRFVYGPLGPLLRDPSIGYVKAFYERPLHDGEQLKPGSGGRVTELVARPLLNMFWPQLAGVVQPLAGEYAGRRALLERLPFATGYGVEFGLLVDVATRFGVDALAQVDLDIRIHRNRPVGDLSRMAFAVVHAALRRLPGSAGRVADDAARTLFQFARDESGRYRVETSTIETGERPPASSVAGYRASR